MSYRAGNRVRKMSYLHEYMSTCNSFTNHVRVTGGRKDAGSLIKK